MRWHCVVKMGRYCIGAPEWEKESTPVMGIKDGEKSEEVRFYSGGTCKLNPETCGKCKTSQQLWNELPQEVKDRLSKPSFVENIIPIEKSKVKGEKPKSKKARQLETEIAQRSMF